MFSRVLKSFVSVGILLYACAGFSKSVYVYEVKSKGIDSSSVDTVYELIKSSVSETDGYDVSEERSSSDLQLKAKLLKLGDSFILALAKYKGKKKTFSAKMKASSLDDMDVVAARITKSVLMEKKPKNTASVDDVTEDEVTRGTRRKQAIRQWEFAFGPAWSNNLNVKGAGTAWHFGYNWVVRPQLDIKLLWRLYVPKDSDEDDAGFSNLTIGTNYFFDKSDTAFFVNGELGYASAAASDDSLIFSDDRASGFALGGGLGVKFLRTSTVNLSLLLNHSIVLSKTENSDKMPGLTVLSLILSYGR